MFAPRYALMASHYVRTALCADVLPTFSKVGARAALAQKTAFLLLAVCFSILRKQMTAVRQARKGGAYGVKEKAANESCY